jgi:hypothetical protein
MSRLSCHPFRGNELRLTGLAQSETLRSSGTETPPVAELRSVPARQQAREAYNGGVFEFNKEIPA